MIPTSIITYRSKNPVHKKPATFTTGGYGVNSADNQPIIFDWESFHANSVILDDGRVEINVVNRTFDTEYANESTDTNISALTPEALANMQLNYVNYECFADETEQEFIALDVVAFVLVDDNQKEYPFKDLSRIEN